MKRIRRSLRLLILNENRNILDKEVYSRLKGKFPKVKPKDIEYMDVSAQQVISVSAGLIPFLEHDDANRALMGSNMQRQGVPLLFPEEPLVCTGIEEKLVRDSGAVVVAKESGVVEEVNGGRIKISGYNYKLKTFERSNADTCVHQRRWSRWREIKKGQIIADGMASHNGELALGTNIMVAFMPWRGYNFEDAIVLSERLVKDDVLTSMHVESSKSIPRDSFG